MCIRDSNISAPSIIHRWNRRRCENYQLIQFIFKCKWHCRPIFDQLRLRKVIKFVAARCQILRLICTKFDFALAPDLTGEAYSTSPDPLAGFKGPTSRGDEGKDRKGKGEGLYSAPNISLKSAPLFISNLILCIICIYCIYCTLSYLCILSVSVSLAFKLFLNCWLLLGLFFVSECTQTPNLLVGDKLS